MIAAFTLALLFSSIPELCTVKADPIIIIVPDDYPTINSAIGNATEGSTIFVRSGLYHEQTLIINKTLSIIGENANNTTISLHPSLRPYSYFFQTLMFYDRPIVIEASAVTLSGFTITTDGGYATASGNQIQVSNNNMNMSLVIIGNKSRIISNNLSVENHRDCDSSIDAISNQGFFILSLTGSNNTIASNLISGSGGGIYAGGSYNILYANSLNVNSSQNGDLNIKGEQILVAKNDLRNLVYLEGSFNTVCANKVMRQLIMVGNNNTIYANYLNGMNLGNIDYDSSNNTIYHNNFDFLGKKNLPQEEVFVVWVGVRGSQILDIGGEGNFWSDYQGADADRNGIGDTPYIFRTFDPAYYQYYGVLADTTLVDNFPLISKFDLSTANITLPDGALPSTPPFSIPTPTPAPTPQPTLSPSPSVPEFPAWAVLPLAVVTAAATLTVKRKRRLKP